MRPVFYWAHNRCTASGADDTMNQRGSPREQGRQQPNKSDFLKTLAERVVIYDGGLGTCIQQCSPTLDDFWGKENCSEVLVLSRPDIVRKIHEDYFAAGADVVETNTFGGSRIVL